MRKSTKQSKAATAPAASPAPKVSPATKGRKRETDRPATKSAPVPAERSEELRFKVTVTCKQQFKLAAKELGLKKSAFLEKLLADWHARQPSPPQRAFSAPQKDVSPAQMRRTKDRR